MAVMAAGRAPGKPGGKRRAGLPPGSPAAYLEAMRFGWLVSLLVFLSWSARAVPGC